MREQQRTAIVICVSMIFSFLYGAITVRYEVFPFDQLRAVKHLVSTSPSTRPSPSHTNYYYHKKSFFEEHGGHEYDIVFIGDSITDGAEWGDLFPSLKIANRGIDGDTTDGVITRMNSIYSTNAKKAFIMIGINDFFAGAEVNNVLENYRSIINNLIAHGMQPYVQSTILADKRRAELNIKIMALNEQLKKMAAENKVVTYIDLNAGLTNGSALDSKYSRDGIHLNGSGYTVWRDTIKGYLR